MASCVGLPGKVFTDKDEQLWKKWDTTIALIIQNHPLDVKNTGRQPIRLTA